jgi:hypothetical protein
MLKKDKEKASQDMIEYLKENSQLKDEMIKQLEEKKRLKENINLELEKKVVERTRELAEANEHINRMNRLLKNSNQKLQSDIQNIEEKRIHNKRVSFKEFQKLYPDNDTCYKYLSNLKWAHGFKCQICGNTKYSAGNTAYSRRCSRCNKIESATSRTVFSRSRIPLKKGFYMLFLIIDSPSVTIDELKNAVDLRRETCWAFRKKITSAFNLQNGKKIKSQSWNDFILLE